MTSLLFVGCALVIAAKPSKIEALPAVPPLATPGVGELPPLPPDAAGEMAPLPAMPAETAKASPAKSRVGLWWTVAPKVPPAFSRKLSEMFAAKLDANTTYTRYKPT